MSETACIGLHGCGSCSAGSFVFRLSEPALCLLFFFTQPPVFYTVQLAFCHTPLPCPTPEPVDQLSARSPEPVDQLSARSPEPADQLPARSNPNPQISLPARSNPNPNSPRCARIPVEHLSSPRLPEKPKYARYTCAWQSLPGEPVCGQSHRRNESPGKARSSY